MKTKKLLYASVVVLLVVVIAIVYFSKSGERAGAKANAVYHSAMISMSFREYDTARSKLLEAQTYYLKASNQEGLKKVEEQLKYIEKQQRDARRKNSGTKP